MVDRNADGLVTTNEIQSMMESRGRYISHTEAQGVARKMDFNRDGVVSRGEFMESVRPKSPPRRY